MEPAPLQVLFESDRLSVVTLLRKYLLWFDVSFRKWNGRCVQSCLGRTTRGIPFPVAGSATLKVAMLRCEAVSSLGEAISIEAA